jgi:hydroxylysine kinase
MMSMAPSAGPASSLPCRKPEPMNPERLIGAAAAVLASPVPEVSLAEAEDLFRNHYGREGVASPLASERDRNFLLRQADGSSFILKVTNPTEDPAVTEFQTLALCHVAKADPELPVPRVIPAQDGALIAAMTGADQRRQAVRLFSWLDGVLLGPRILGSDGLRDVGRVLARLTCALSGFLHPGEEHALLWDMQHAASLRPLLSMISKDEARAWVTTLLDRFAARVLPLLPDLPTGVIHNDLTGSNILMQADNDQRVAGVLDFGDLVRAPLVQEIGVTASYHLDLREGADLFTPLRPLLAGYEAVRPLSEREASVLYDLMATRLALRALIPAWRAQLYPENRDYLMRNAGRAWQVMQQVAEMDPSGGQARLLALWSLARQDAREEVRA